MKSEYPRKGEGAGKKGLRKWDVNGYHIISVGSADDALEGNSSNRMSLLEHNRPISLYGQDGLLKQDVSYNHASTLFNKSTHCN